MRRIFFAALLSTIGIMMASSAHSRDVSWRWYCYGDSRVYAQGQARIRVQYVTFDSKADTVTLRLSQLERVPTDLSTWDTMQVDLRRGEPREIHLKTICSYMFGCAKSTLLLQWEDGIADGRSLIHISYEIKII